MMLGKVLLVLAAAITLCSASGQFTYGFPLDSLLQCKIPSRFGQVYGDSMSIPGPVPLIPNQPGNRGEVYLPLESMFATRINFGRMSAMTNQRLASFLGVDTRVLSIGELMPSRPPILPSTVLPGTTPVTSGTDGGLGTTVAPATDRRDEIREILSSITIPFVDATNIDTITNIVGQLTDRCVPSANWTRLPPSYFPQWVSAGLCGGQDCSIPEGLFCNYDWSEDAIIPLEVLRWDCCWSIINRQWRWECGWRKVKITLAGRCVCSCEDDLGSPNAYTGRINGVFTSHIQGLNTRSV